MRMIWYVVRHPVMGYLQDVGRQKNRYTIRLTNEPGGARLYATLSGAKAARERCVERCGAGFVVEEREVETA